MSRSIAILSTLLALMALAGSAVPVAAATPDGAFARFPKVDGAGGLLIVDYIDQDELSLHTAFAGLELDRRYRIIGRSIGCNGNPSSNNRIFSIRLRSDDSGGLFRSSFLTTDPQGPTWVPLRSIWIDLAHPVSGDALPRCARAPNFEKLEVATGDVNGDGALGLIASTYGRGIFLVERRANSRARVTVLATGFLASDEYFVKGVGTSCGQKPSMAQSYFGLKLQDVLVSSFTSRVVDLGQEELDALRSVRIQDMTEGKRWGCGPAQIMAEWTRNE